MHAYDSSLFLGQLEIDQCASRGTLCYHQKVFTATDKRFPEEKGGSNEGEGSAYQQCSMKLLKCPPWLVSFVWIIDFELDNFHMEIICAISMNCDSKT